MKLQIAALLLVLSACASAPVPRCIPPDLSRAPESGTLGTTMPRAAPQTQEEYARCKKKKRMLVSRNSCAMTKQQRGSEKQNNWSRSYGKWGLRQGKWRTNEAAAQQRADELAEGAS